MPITITQVDAFTSEPFKGNPAAVCVLPEERDPEWMQNVAREMNLAETAFLLQRPDGYGLRWFTPTVEVDLCGHATLASAHVLWETGRLAADETARFQTRSGLLTAVRRGDWIELDFPATPDEPVAAPPGLVESLGASPRYVGKSRFDYLVELENEDAVRGVRPDFGVMKRSAQGASSLRVVPPTPTSTSFRDTSRPPSGSTKTPSPARRTVAWRRSGVAG